MILPKRGLKRADISHWVFSILILLLSLTFNVPSAQARERPQSGDQRSLQLDGLKRTYLQIVPAHCKAASANCPLVFGFHGGGLPGVSGAQFDQESGMSKAASARGFILILPNARDANWNDGRPEVGETADDVGFVKAILGAIKSENLSYDAARVFATGMSNGGHMSFRLACEMADTFAAIAPVAASRAVQTIQGGICAEYCWHG
jgi:polyhydroxybutyrate depolymerase